MTDPPTTPRQAVLSTAAMLAVPSCLSPPRAGRHGSSNPTDGCTAAQAGGSARSPARRSRRRATCWCVRAVVREYSDPTLLPPASGAVSPAPTSRDNRASAFAGSVGVTSIRLRLVCVFAVESARVAFAADCCRSRRVICTTSRRFGTREYSRVLPRTSVVASGSAPSALTRRELVPQPVPSAPALLRWPNLFAKLFAARPPVATPKESPAAPVCCPSAAQR